MRVRGISINGGLTGISGKLYAGNEVAEPLTSEASSYLSWNVIFYSGNVNPWNLKYSALYVRPCTEYVEYRRFVEGWFMAYEDCLRGKRSSPQTLEYMPRAAEDVPRLACEVWERRYEPQESTCFMVTFPKLREVFAAAFRDRIVHHWISLRLLPLFEDRCHELGDVSHACRRGYGTRTAIEQVQRGMLEVSGHLKREAWVYKGDIVGFFMNIDKGILWDMLQRLIRTKYTGEDKETLLYLTRKTVFHHPERNCVIQSDVGMWREIRRDKSLFFIDDRLGEPIGNLTTQLFAGYYLSYLDEYVKGLFVGRNYSYTRSVDDFVIVCDEGKFLKQAIGRIGKFTKERLGLECHGDKVYFQPVTHGVKFLGEIVYAHRRYTINRTIGRMMERVRACGEESARGMTEMRAEEWAQVLNSYFGFLTQANEYRTRTRIMEMLPRTWYKYFSIENRKKVIIKKNYRYERN